MIEVQFSHNYNGKLFCDHFLEVFPSDAMYYTGNMAVIKLNSLDLGIAKIEHVRSIPFNKLNDVISFLAIGNHSVHLAKQIKGKNKKQEIERLSLVVFSYAQRNYEVQSELLQDWWNNKKPDNDNF